MSQYSKKANIRVERLENEYIKLFKEKNTAPTSDSDKSSAIVNEYIEAPKNITFEEKVNQEELKEIILNLPNGKCSGFCGVSNEMLKYSRFFNISINHQQRSQR